eukprot:1416191-Alexandrium_andersonii.AAC.1
MGLVGPTARAPPMVHWVSWRPAGSRAATGARGQPPWPSVGQVPTPGDAAPSSPLARRVGQEL